ncbi:hypothetical protein BVG18_17835 (plasmid) [Acinetobacter lwoffii]|uniref:surface-adhesin E family protein n=1 Tax=Acinetobacter lwoffii TaxID=28090 RepID=UPI0012A25DDC|nr:hypothetical protein BVG18_17835 [Acinetobacter lwoffii]
MLKNILLLGVLCSGIGLANASSDAVLERFNQLSDEGKESFKVYLNVKEWINVGESSGDSFDINYKYLKTKPYGIVETWIRATVTNDIVEDGLGVGDYTMFLYNFNCLESSLKVLSYTNYKKSGKNLNSVTNPSYTSFKPVIPGSVGENLLNSSCNFNTIKNS